METTTKLVYRENFENNSYSLVELATPELVEAFESGNSIAIKGLAEDEAVLCTDSKTYIVRQVNTSNSIVLLEKEERDFGRHYVRDDVSNTIELLPCLARLGRLDDLLGGTLYSGQENEDEVQQNKLYTRDDLLSTVQASEKELMEGLNQKGAFLHEGFYRLFDKDYLFQLFDALMTNATIEGLDIKCMLMEEAKHCIVEEMKKQLEGSTLYIPDHVLEATIHNFTKTTNSKSSFLQFDEYKICRFLGEWLLANPTLSANKIKRWKLEEFLEYWNTMGHNVFVPKLEYLGGLYITRETVKVRPARVGSDKEGKYIEKYIEYFPIHQLSTDPPTRFASLFSEKPLWSNEEIQPFLMDLAPVKKDRETLLLKFARTHKTGDSILYGSRIK